MDERFCYWLAALIDGEGSIVWRHRAKTQGRYAYSLIIANNHRGLLEKAQEYMGTGTIYPSNRAFQLRVEKQSEVIRILKQVAPLLIVKRSKAEEALKNLANQTPVVRHRDPVTGKLVAS